MELPCLGPRDVRRNTTTISTANGKIVPKWAVDANIPVMTLRLPNGATKQASIRYSNAIVMPTCGHNLVPVTSMAVSHGLALRVEPPYYS